MIGTRERSLEMNHLYMPSFIDKGLCDFLKEYIETKILFSPQDIDLYEFYFSEDKKNILQTKRKFTEENIDDLYDHDIPHYTSEHIFIEISISHSIIETIEKTFENSKKFQKKIKKMCRNKPKYYNESQKYLSLIKKEMTENGYISFNDLYEFLRMKLFTHDVRLTQPSFWINKNNKDDNIFKVYINFE